MKLPCKLCEMSMNRKKIEDPCCTHKSTPFPLGGAFTPFPGAMDQNPFLFPQVKDLVLAYFLRGYYQPAGPLITLPHGHIQPQLVKGAPISDIASPSPLPAGVRPPAPSSAGDSSDNEVIITSVTAAKEPQPPQQPPPAYRFSQYHPAPHHAYSYTYPPQYYAVPPPPAPAYTHHDICYSPTPYLHHKYPPSYRRYLPNAQYYQHNTTELYNSSGIPNQQTQQVSTANAAAVDGNAFRSPQNAPPTLLEPYPPPASTTLVESYPAHYYPAYGPVPPPSCFTHSAPSRTIPYINAAAYQSCPCPMQSCPKNVLTGPLTGDSKRSTISISKESIPLPPVASLALPLEPASATGPPSPARGSAGMPPPPSPAGATYQSGMTPKLEATDVDCKPLEKRRKARIGKSMVRNNIAAHCQQNTMLLMCQSSRDEQFVVKREVESPKEVKKDVCDQGPELFTLSTPTPCQKCTAVENGEVKIVPEVQTLKTEETEESLECKMSDEATEKCENVEPCQKTVAENVKVKNMKRKLLEKDTTEDESTQKRAKVEDPKANGSYKDLIKKHTTTVKINNGKRKLNIENQKAGLTRNNKFKVRRVLLKRNSTKDDSIGKRVKSSKPLTANNSQNVVEESVEKKEPFLKSSKKLVNTRKSECVDRTNTSAVNDACVRTVKDKASDKCKNCKNEKKPGKSLLKTNNNVNVCRKKKVKKSEAVPQAVSKVPRRSFQSPKWSNGWTWEGEPFEAKVFINSDETTIIRKCYPKMRHREGDLIEPRDCVLLKAGQRKNELPFVAKIAALWENPDDGEMMMSLLWYYRPEHTEQGRLPSDQPDEVFASRHKDSNSVACIEDKCYVLTFNEYCRYRKELRRLQEGIEHVPCIPVLEPYLRQPRQPPTPLQTPVDLVFYCRKVYDFRQKRIMKNPS